MHCAASLLAGLLLAQSVGCLVSLNWIAIHDTKDNNYSINQYSLMTFS
jgi:hypothetical protein